MQLLWVGAFLPLNQLLSDKDVACKKAKTKQKKSRLPAADRQHKTMFYKANHPKNQQLPQKTWTDPGSLSVVISFGLVERVKEDQQH